MEINTHLSKLTVGDIYLISAHPDFKVSDDHGRCAAVSGHLDQFHLEMSVPLCRLVLVWPVWWAGLGGGQQVGYFIGGSIGGNVLT